MNEILQYLKTNGERLDIEIAQATKLSLSKTRLHLAELAAKGDVISCYTIKIVKGNKTEGISCRLTGFTPPAAPGRKAKASLAS